ncbi:MAG: hypothetical protein E7346_04920 [Clostridiales bacterium]|nr:hypothetical protein [Clostridiales bacterium]MBQ3046915.1 hypothetical protein [Clostridia bacterium]
MLSRVESAVMLALHGACGEKGATLITPVDLKRLVGADGIGLSRLDTVMTDLASDGYFDLVYSDRRGETVYCVSLTEKGKGYIRERKVFRRNLIYRIGLTAALALLSFLIGLILKAIF